MDKLKYIKLENEDGSYSDSIPLAVDSDHVDVNGNVLTDVLDAKADDSALSDLSAEVNTQKTRIDNLSHLDEGSTTGDAELIDIRSGYKGVAYTNAGDAVRNNSKRLSKIDKELLKPMSHNRFNLNDNRVLQGKYIDVSGQIKDYTGSSGALVTAPMYVVPGETLYRSQNTTNVAYYNDKDQLVGIELYNTKNNPITVPNDQSIAYMMTFFYGSGHGAFIGDSQTYDDFLPAENIAKPIVERADQKSIFYIRELAEEESINYTDFSRIENKFFNRSGEYSNLPNGYSLTKRINVNAGERYRYFGREDYLSAYATFLDSAENVIQILSNPDSHTARENGTEHIIDIPTGVEYLQVFSYTPNEEVKECVLELKKVGEKEKEEQRVLNIIDNYDIGEKYHNFNILHGKKWVACGDSFTEGDFSGWYDDQGRSGKNSPVIYDSEWGMYKTYPWWIGKRNSMNIINEAKCGSILALDQTYVEDPDHVPINTRNPFSYQRYLNIPEDTDYITIAFGLNDMYHVNLGTIDDDTNETFYGALNMILEYYLINRPFAKIGLIVMNSYMREPWATAIKEAGAKWGVPVLDMMFDPSVNVYMPSDSMCEQAKTIYRNNFYVTSSNGHPNLKAHELESSVIESFLRSL